MPAGAASATSSMEDVAQELSIIPVPIAWQAGETQRYIQDYAKHRGSSKQDHLAHKSVLVHVISHFLSSVLMHFQPSRECYINSSC